MSKLIPSLVRKRLRVLQLAAVIFFTVSGGPFGIEPLFKIAGGHGALLLLALTPLLWDIPSILTVLELNSMMPINGGYYQWVKKALGLRWAFFEGYWTWLYTFVDLAIYPVLFLEYASFFIPHLQAYKIPVCLAIIWSSAIINIIGIVPVGKISMILGMVVLIPFALLCGIIFYQHRTSFSIPSLSLTGISFPAIGLGLYTVMWNFFGWDNATTYAGEVQQPGRSYVISCAVAFFSIFLMYWITSLAVVNARVDFGVLNEQGFPLLGANTGYRWMGILLAIGGMASAIGLFSAVLLSVSRVPEVMANDGLLPQKLKALHPRFQTPYVSIVISAVIISLMILWTFSDLVIMDVTLYGAGLFLEFISLLVLRKKSPHAHRPFRIPLGIAGLCLMFLLSISVYSVGLFGAFASSEKTFFAAAVAVLALISAEFAWWLVRLKRRKERLV